MGTSGQNSHMLIASGPCPPVLASETCTSQHQSCWRESRCFQIPTDLGTGTLKILPWSCWQRHWPLPHPLGPCVASLLLGKPHVPFRGQLSSSQPPLPTHLPLSPTFFCPSLPFHASNHVLRMLALLCVPASLSLPASLSPGSLLFVCISAILSLISGLWSVHSGIPATIHSPCLSTLSCRGVLSLWLSSPTQHLLTWLSRGHLCARLAPTTHSRILKLVSWHRFLGKVLFVSVLKYIYVKNMATMCLFIPEFVWVLVWKPVKLIIPD